MQKYGFNRTVGTLKNLDKGFEKDNCEGEVVVENHFESLF